MPTLIAVGGTGQHIAATIARLSLLGAIGRDWALTVIDADTHNELSTHLHSMDGWVSQDHGCAHPLAGLRIRTPYDAGARAAGDAGATTIETLVLANGCSAEASALFHALYPQHELQQKLDDGFYARPMLGASAFGAMGTALLNGVKDDTNGQKVVVCGSFIGGTGAGVLPALVEKCADKNTWHGVFLSDWLDLAEGALQGNPLPLNRAHGLEYFYRHIRAKLRASALLGAPPNPFDTASLLPTTPTKSGVECYSLFIAAAALHVVAMVEDTTADGTGRIDTYQMDTANPRQLSDANVSTQTKRSVTSVVRKTREGVMLAEELCSGETGVAWRKSARTLNRIFGAQDAVPSALDAATKRLASDVKMDRADLIDRCLDALRHRAEAAKTTAGRLEATFAGARAARMTHARPEDAATRVAKRLAQSPLTLPASAPRAADAPNVLADTIATSFGLPVCA